MLDNTIKGGMVKESEKDDLCERVSQEILKILKRKELTFQDARRVLNDIDTLLMQCKVI